MFTILATVLSISLITIILIQIRGSGATLFGQAESSFRVRRGFERILFRGTILLAILFVIVAILNVIF